MREREGRQTNTYHTRTHACTHTHTDLLIHESIELPRVLSSQVVGFLHKHTHTELRHRKGRTRTVVNVLAFPYLRRTKKADVFLMSSHCRSGEWVVIFNRERSELNVKTPLQVHSQARVAYVVCACVRNMDALKKAVAEYVCSHCLLYV